VAKWVGESLGCLLLATWLLGHLATCADDFPQLFYSKSFPGSEPAYSQITIDAACHGTYQEAAEDDDPIRFQLTKRECDAFFKLAGKLDYFKRPLASDLKVANTGIKTFRYDDGKQKHEQKFNYSENEDARQMWDWFECIAESEWHFINLQRAVRFDKLGVDRALLLFETSKDRGRLVATAQFLPLLDRIAKNETYLHMDRVRAANLADAIRKENQPE
jgi:hypothetical protein